jgi:hypothetical protein
MIKLIGLALILTSMTTARTGQMSPACTMHGGVVVCFSVPGPAPVAGDGPCYAAQRQVVAAQGYAAEHSDQPNMIAQKMIAATSKLFKACSTFPAPQATNSVVPAARNS